MLDRFKLTHRVWVVLGTFWLVFALAVGAGLLGLSSARDSLKYVHDERMSVAGALAAINRNFYENRLQVLLAFQHDPAGALFNIHDTRSMRISTPFRQVGRPTTRPSRLCSSAAYPPRKKP